MHARLDRGRVSLLTRTGLDWTRKNPCITAALTVLPARQAYLDGELCGIRSDGKTSFSMIQAASDSGNADALVFFLFDLLYLDGEMVSARSPASILLPLTLRRREVSSLLGDNRDRLDRRGANTDDAGALAAEVHALVRPMSRLPRGHTTAYSLQPRSVLRCGGHYRADKRRNRPPIRRAARSTTAN
jgi:ATP-dependent DNA ligase